MTRKRRPHEQNSLDLTVRQYKKRKRLITSDLLIDIQPLTKNQERFFEFYDQGQNIVAFGSAGSGKTLVAMYKALKDVLDERTPYDKVLIMRNPVQSFDLGFLPGLLGDKLAPFEVPYKYMVKKLFTFPTEEEYELLYGNLKSERILDFSSVSFLRGSTFDDCIIIVDEFQNLNGHLLSSVITRVGQNCKIIFAGDAAQTDLTKQSDRKGLADFVSILEMIPSFSFIEFTMEDCVRSGLVRDYLIAKDKYEREQNNGQKLPF
jgi:phosphate starvation-inducible protein PhoH